MRIIEAALVILFSVLLIAASGPISLAYGFWAGMVALALGGLGCAIWAGLAIYAN